MAKLPPIQGIMSELKKHCEDRIAIEKAVRLEEKPVKKMVMDKIAMNMNLVIAHFCELLEVIEIPKDQLDEVLAGLKNLQKYHLKIGQTIEILSKSQS